MTPARIGGRGSNTTEYGLVWACTPECADGEGGCWVDGRIFDGDVVGQPLTAREAARWKADPYLVSDHPVRLVRRSVRRSGWKPA